MRSWEGGREEEREREGGTEGGRKRETGREGGRGDEVRRVPENRDSYPLLSSHSSGTS